jgi:hypothetical protein
VQPHWHANVYWVACVHAKHIELFCEEPRKRAQGAAGKDTRVLTPEERAVADNAQAQVANEHVRHDAP